MNALMMLSVALAGEWRWAGGTEVNASPFGILDLGWRTGPWSVQLLTDTLDARYQTELERGKVWGAARLEFGAAGLISGPWTDGAPDPTAAMLASYGGIEGGWQRYLQAGLYAGVEGFSRQYWFGASSETLAVAEPQLLSMGQAVLGYWRPAAQARLAAGVHIAPDGAALFAPHLTLQAKVLPEWTVAPRVEVYGGIAQGQDFLSRTRLGGLNPYVVPLAGAGWAEWWVEDYAALRAGPSASVGPAQIAAVVDAAWFDGQTAVGLGLPVTLRWDRFTIDTAFGYAPWIARQDGVGRWSVLVLIGRGWG